MKVFLRSLYYSASYPFASLRSKKISRNYRAHYREAQGLWKFAKDGRQIRSLDELRVRLCIPGVKDNNIINLPNNFPCLTKRIQAEVAAQLEYSKNCLFFPKIDVQSIPERTEDIPAVRNGEVIAVQVKNYSAIASVEDLCREVLPEIEERVYGSPVLVDKVYIYRNLVSHREEQVSWMWHYDNHPAEILKIMIYLTDVEGENGPFEYLRSKETGEAVLMGPKPLCGYTRIPAKRIEQYLSDGYEAHKVFGPSGTIVLFDNNVIHKANIAQKRYRDVIVLQVRPSTFQPKSYIDPRWTGSFQHMDFNPNPYDYQPKLKPSMLSG